MYPQPTTVETIVHPDPTAPTLRGRWLVIARVVWIIVAVLTVVGFTASLPAGFEYQRSVCTAGNCLGEPLTLEKVRTLRSLGLSTDVYAAYKIVVQVIFAIVWCAVGAVIFWRKSDNWMALFGALALVAFGGATFPGTVGSLGVDYPNWWLPISFVRLLGRISIDFFFFLFPDGQFVPRWARRLVVVWMAFHILDYYSPIMALQPEAWPHPLPFLVDSILPGSLIVAQIYRYRYVSGPIQRQQTKWVVFGIVAGVGGFIATLALALIFPSLEQDNLLFGLALHTAVYLSILLIPLSIGIAILRSHLWDIDLIINRTLVYGSLTASVVGLYVLVVGGLSVLFQTGGNLLISLLATAVVAVLFAPLRDRLQRAINRLLYGQRDDPYIVLSRLGQRLEAALAPEAVLPTIAAIVKEALKLPYVAIALDQEGHSVEVAAAGSVMPNPLCLPLSYQGETIGQLILAPRALGETFAPAERRLLNDLAHQAGVAAAAVRLTADLQRSRERLVTAREEERRRLRRDLHDGLGPALAAHTLKIGSARALLARDPAAADVLLAELESDIQAALADIRRLVYNLRPPSLDELGLLGAIRESAAQYGWLGERQINGNDAHRLHIALAVPERLPPLAAAVEVAAYRIVQEALTNVLRHAQAQTCHIHLRLDEMLRLEITDDGVGLPPERHAGVGLASMRERAQELGGTCQIESVPTGGVRVVARLPLLRKEELGGTEGMEGP